MFKALVSATVIASMLAGCSTHNADGKIDANIASHGIARPEHNGTFLPSGSFRLSPNYAITYVDMILVAGLIALVYQVVDPAAPAWDILEKRLPDGRVQYSLRMQYIHNGGEGEARQVLARRAAELAREQGMAGYQIQSYTESIDSRLFLPRRTADAEVILLAAEVPKTPPVAARPPLASM